MASNSDPTRSNGTPISVTRRALLGAGFVLPVVAGAWGAAAGTEARSSPAYERLRVAASTPIFADIVANVGGERTDAWSIIPVGADPHTWEPTPKDIQQLADSDTFIYMGAKLEPFVDTAASKRILRESGVPVLEMATYLDLIRVDKVIAHGDHTHDVRGGDPHVWLDPLKGIVLAGMIAAHLSRIDPAGEAVYSANAAAYSLELEAIDAAYEDTLSRISPDRRKLVVFHDAYTYFAARYGFEIVGIVLPNPEGEPSAGEIARLIATIEAEGIDVIFAEPQFDTDPLDAVVAETGIEIGLLMTDTFTEDVDSYMGLLRFNLESLRDHLGPS